MKKTASWLSVAALCVVASVVASRAQIVTRVVDQIVATTCAANQWINAIAVGGTATCAQPATTNLSDVTAATTWLPTDASPGGLTFTSRTGNFGKGNKTCTGSFRLTFPVTADTNVANIALPCTFANNGNHAIGACWSTAAAASPNVVMIFLGGAGTAAASMINTAGGVAQPTNANLSTLTLSCFFSFITT